MAQRGYPAHAALAAFVQQVPVLWLRGGIGQALPACRAVVERDPSRPALRAVLSWVAAEAGETDEARTQLEAVDVGRFVAGEPAVDWWAALTACANAARILDDAGRADIIRRALLPYADRNAVFGQVAFYGAVSHHLGVLSHVIGDDAAAVAHLERALERHEAMGAEPFVALTAAELSGGPAREPVRGRRRCGSGRRRSPPGSGWDWWRPPGGQRPGRGVIAGWASRARTRWGKTSVAAFLPIRASRWA